MKISHQWLQTLIPLKLAPAKLADGLSMLGLEIERYESLGGRLDNFVVGEVLTKERHPNADKLTVCQVTIGKETLSIVCGAPNVAPGQKVPVGLVGATVPKNQHDPNGAPFVLQRAKIRGVESQGMICSEYELDLGPDKDGIMVLDSSAKTGNPLAKYLGRTDVIYDIEITANRGDWLSHVGVAREISALTGKRLTMPKIAIRENREAASSYASIRIDDTKGCPRYIGRVLRNVRVGPSPAWLQERLLSVNVRPVNNIVDVTNYVMLETGQPLHAFDHDKLAGGKIIVRAAREAEPFLTLDGKQRTLRSGTLLICDAEKPVAIAGVMGGLNTEIGGSTVNVFLESAFFDPATIRWASKYLGLSTEASQRFERCVDKEMTLYAANRTASLLQQLAGADVLKGVLDVYPNRKRKVPAVKIQISRTNALLGTNLSKPRVSSILKRLGLSVRSVSSDVLEAAIPSFRADLLQEIDLIEEVARMYGYNNIKTQASSTIEFNLQPSDDPEKEIREILMGAGFNEIVTNSLQNKAHATLAKEPAVEVLNPVSIDMEMLRTSMIPGALDVVQHNFNRGIKGLRIVEFGKVFRREEGSAETLEGYSEEPRIIIVLTGDHFNQHYSVSGRKYDLLDLKGEVESLLTKFFLDKYRLIWYDNDKPLSVDNLHVEIQGTYAGFLGRLRKEITARFGIEEDVFVAELSMNVLSSFWRREKKFQALPRFPSVTRDLAFVVEWNIPQGNVEEAIRESGGGALKSLVLFDLYTGEQVGAGKKSLAYALEFQPIDRTLTDDEANAIVSRIVKHVQQACGAVLRT